MDRHHGIGRGGRGQSFLMQSSLGRPGLSEQNKETSEQSGLNLLPGGRGSLGRRSALLLAADRQNVSMGRGMFFLKTPGKDSSELTKHTEVEKATDKSTTGSISEDASNKSSHSDFGTLSLPAELSGTDPRTDSGLPQSKSAEKEQIQPPPQNIMQTKFGSMTLGRGYSGSSMVPLGRGLKISGMPTPLARLAMSSKTALLSRPGVGRPEHQGIVSTHSTSGFPAKSTHDRLIKGTPTKVGLMKPAELPNIVSTGRGLTLRHRQLAAPTVGARVHQDAKLSPKSISKEKPALTVREVSEYHGSSGLEIPSRVNCVHIKCKNPVIYQYHVSFKPDIDNRSLRFSLINQHRDFIGQKAFDGSILYLTKDIGGETTLVSESITDGTKIDLKILMTARLNPASSRLIPFYNVVMHKVMKILKLCPVGRNYYDPCCPKSVPKYNLDLWPGYVTAIREMEGGLYLNVDCSFKVLRNETVLSFMQGLFRTNKSDFRGRCIKDLVGTTVLTRYNNNNYRVDDIDWSLNPIGTFTDRKGGTVSFVDYYKAQYKLEIKDLKQPMLVHRPKKATQRSDREQKGEDRIIYLVPELCYLTGISDSLASDFSAMKDIGEITRMGPSARNLHVEDFLKRINSNSEAKEELLKWGLELESRCAPVKARVLNSEKVMVGDNKVFQCNEQVDFFRDISRAPVLHSVPIRNWIMVFTSRDHTKAKDFVSKLNEVARCVGMQVQPPKFIELKDDRSESYKRAISQEINESLQLVVCIFPTLRDDRYSAIKRLCCAEQPVPSQVIISKTLPRDAKMGKFRSVTMKIALQINCKLGGELWAVSIPLEGLMVCGIDVYHEGKGQSGRSVAGFVASMNKLATRWHSRAVQQGPNQEIIDGLKHCFCDAILKYHGINRKLPDRIVIYRDGVGDGQLSVVAEHEVEQLKAALGMFEKFAGGEYEPKFTFVVVSKRINIRYFRDGGNTLVNPPPGSVLDHTTTRPNWPDFYLVSQHVRQGTVSPTHYIVISGSANMKPDHLQRLTYKLTHMYYNWPGTVRVPAPCQYAHKLAYLIGENVRKEPSPELCDRLFYL